MSFGVVHHEEFTLVTKYNPVTRIQTKYLATCIYAHCVCFLACTFAPLTLCMYVHAWNFQRKI